MITVLLVTGIAVLTILGAKLFFFLGMYPWNDGPYLVAGNDPSRSVTICWITAKRKESRLFWGTGSRNLPQTSVSRETRFHSITINNLLPETVYFYTIEEKFPLYKKGAVFHFHTASEKNSGKPLLFAAAGDLQPRDNRTLRSNRLVSRQIDRESPDCIIQTGDTVQLGSRAKSWHYLMRSLPVMASSRPFLPAAGNHEHYIIHSSRNFRSIFPCSYPVKRCSCYSVDIGTVHISFLDPYDGGFNGMNSRITQRQKQWFAADLHSAVRNKTQWIFVVLHQPVFTTGEYANDVRLRNWILPILSLYDVDAVFYGHSHLYEHWQYRYGANGYLLNDHDSPGTVPIHFFCTGSSGARLESSYHVFSHKPFKLKKEHWVSTKTGKAETVQHIQYPWDKSVFFATNHRAGHCSDPTRQYYQLPSNSCTVHRWFGYQYGEITLHYAKIRVKNKTCTISVHYPDGSLLTGPNGLLPQEFVLRRKNRT